MFVLTVKLVKKQFIMVKK